MTKNAVAIALFPPLEPANPVPANDYDRGFEAGLMSAKTSNAAAIAALRRAFEAARAESEAASLLVRDEMIEATRRLLVACAPALATCATLDALSEALSVAIDKQGPVSIRVASDIADTVRALAGDIALEIDPSSPNGSVSVRWRDGGLDSNPLRAIETVVELIKMKSCKDIGA